MRNLFFTCSVAVLLVASVAGPAPADDWLFFRGPNLDGLSKETGWQAKFPAAGPKVAWRAELGTGAASVTVAGDKVLTSGNQNNNDVIWCLSAADGAVVWKHSYPCDLNAQNYQGGTAATPTIEGDKVYTFSRDGQVHCLNLADGKVVWRVDVTKEFGGKPSRWKYASSPLVLGNLVIVDIGGSGNSTLALNKATGAKVWGAGNDAAGYATVIPFKVGQNVGLLVFKADAMIGVDAVSGRELFRIPWKTSFDVNASTPTVIGNAFFMSSGYPGGRGAVYQVANSGVKQVWLNNDIKTKMNSALVYDGHVYGISQKGRGLLMCIDVQTGKTLWEQGDFGFGTLTCADGKLIVLSDKGELSIAEASPKGFNAISRAKIMGGTCWVVPVLANGRLYCKNNSGEMICFDLRGAAVSSE